MKDVYRVPIRRSGRRRATALLLAGALVLYGASFLARPSAAPQVRSAGVRVTREEELPAVSFYPVILTESSDPLRARVESARYAPRGAAGYVWQSGDLYRAVAALYLREEEAERAAENLLRQAQIPCEAGQMRAPGALLRLTATQEQSAALRSADEMLPTSVGRLGELAQAIDEGLTDAAQARAALSTEAARIDEARVLLEAEFPGRGGTIPQGLAVLLKDAAVQARALAAGEGKARLTLSGEIRCWQAELAGRFCAYRAALTGRDER